MFDVFLYLGVFCWIRPLAAFHLNAMANPSL